MKRRDSDTPDLFDRRFTPPAPGALTGLKARIAHVVSAVIRNSGVDRYEIAAAMSALLGEDVPKTMLDAYSAESRDDQNIPAYRFLAFLLATESPTALDDLVRPFGWRLLVGEQTKIAALTHLQIQRDQLDRRIKTITAELKGRRS